MIRGKVKQVSHRILGEYFRKKREEANLSQAYVADALGYSSAQMVSNWERGACGPPYSNLKQLMQLYGLSKKDVIEVMTNATREELRVLLK